MGTLKPRALALPLLLVALMVAPPWLSAAAQAPGLPPTPLPSQADPLVRLLQDLQEFLGDTQQVGQELTKDGPGSAPGAALGRANATQAQVEEAAEQLDNGAIRTLFYEGFENGATFRDLGWSQEVLRGSAPWGIVDQVNNTVVRGDGSVFEPEYESGESPVVVKDGRHAATLLNPAGRYDPLARGRLISPPIDLRGVVGGSARTDDPYDLLTRDPRVGEPYRTFLGFWRDSLGELNGGTYHSQTLAQAYGWILTTPPSQLQRLYFGPRHSDAEVPCSVPVGDNQATSVLPCGAVGEKYFANPLAERYGAGLINLTFYHKYDLVTTRSDDLPGARQDGLFLEARVLHPDGTAGPWELLLGDSVFEPTVNDDFPLPSQGTTQPLSSAGVWPSGVVEQGQGILGGGVDYHPTFSRYNGRVQVRDANECYGSQSPPQAPERPANCLPDVPAFVLTSPGRVKSHFTLNRYAGHQIQVAWRVHSGSGSIPAEASGWFLDAVRVDALLYARDAAVNAVTAPRDGDLVPTSVLVQPEAVVQNMGFQAMEGLRVNFTIYEHLPALTPEGAVEAASADAVAGLGAADQVPLPGTPDPNAPGVPTAPGVPGAPTPPGNTLGAARQQAQLPRILLQSGAFVPRLEPLEKVTVESPVGCTACVPGRYRLKVEASLGLGTGAPGEVPAERVEDGGRANNVQESLFEVRDLPAANLQVIVAASSVLTDINEPKTLRVQVENTGNTPLSGVVELTGRLLDGATLRPIPGQPAFPVGSLFIGPGELPPSRRVTSYGQDDPFVQGEVTWSPTNLPPGIYLLEARFNAEPRLATPATTAVNAFIRASPTPYFPGDGRDREDFDLRRDQPDGFSRDLPRYADVVNRGWTYVQPEANHQGPLPQPLGSVSGNQTWNAHAGDGPLLELAVLSLLEGNVVRTPALVPGPPGGTPLPPGVVNFWQSTARSANALTAVTIKPESEGLRVCVNLPAGQPCDHTATNFTGNTGQRFLGYRDLDNLVFSLRPDHSFLNDYYLTRTVTVNESCPNPCQLSFWHTGRFAWQGGVADRVALPGALGGDWNVPGGVQSVSPDQAVENRSRALLEITVLDHQGATVRQDLAPGEIPSPGEQRPFDGCALTSAAQACTLVGTAAPCTAPAQNQPLPDLSQVLPVVGETFHQRLVAGGAVCAADAVARPVADAVVLKEWRTDVPHWNRTVVDLEPFRGKRIALAFHFQTTVGRQETNFTTEAILCTPQSPAVYCTQSRLDQWKLDNIRVGSGPEGNGSAGFYDPVGDPRTNTEWQNWSRFRTLRDVADASLTLAPQCYSGSGPVGGAPVLSVECVRSSRFTGGPVLSVDGRGWDVFTHRLDDPTDELPENPYYDGWFLDDTAGFQPPGREDVTRAKALRWGGPGFGGEYPPPDTTADLYSIASLRLVSLAQSAAPFLEFQANYTFRRSDKWTSGEFKDGGSVFLARYHRDPGCEGRLEECLVLDRRTIVFPEGGYPGRVFGNLEGSVDAGGLDIDWTVYDRRNAPLNNAFVGQSGNDAKVSQFVPVRIDLRQALDGLCLKEVDGVLRSFPRESLDRKVVGCNHLLSDVEWSNGVGVHKDTGLTFRNITTFDQDPEARYAIEFHTQNGARSENNGGTGAFGLAIDDLRLAEQFRANDIGVSRFVAPGAGRVVGPDEAVQVRVNVTNHGLFTQRGVRVNFNVTQQGAQVFPDPFNASRNPAGCSLRACSQVTPLGLAFPGLREDNPQRNVTVAFEVPWTPQGQGLFTLNAWTELIGEFVAGELVPLADENVVNDLFSQDVEVRKVHSVRLLPASEHPDEAAVSPLVGTADDLRTLRVRVENLGTVSEGDGTFEEVDTNGDGVADRRVPRYLNVTVEILDENGRRVPNQPDPRIITSLAPGRSLDAEFRWQPPSGGLFTLRFRAHSDLDLVHSDNERNVRVLVLTQLIPAPGQHWDDLFSPEGRGWSNLSRELFDQGKAWSFGVGDGYGPLQDGSLVLDVPAGLTSFRNAVLTLRHRYDFEQGYDGGVVEVSADGKEWQAVAPLRTTDAAGNVLFEGYPGLLTTASQEVARPGDAVGAFTGASGGIVTSVVPLGTVDLTRTQPVTLLRDTFDAGALLAGVDLPELRGRWVEIVSNSTPPTGKAWWVNKSLVWSGYVDAWDATNATTQREGITLEGHKTLYAVPRDSAGQVRKVPKIDAPLVVEYDEWRALGLGRRGGATLQSGYLVPNTVEVQLERLNVSDLDQVLQSVPVLPRAAEAQDPYADNYLDWTRRTIIVPSTQAQQLLDQPLRLAFRVYLANANNEGDGPFPFTNADHGTGSPEDTDFRSPNLGWAVASPKIYFITSKARCDEAGLTFRDGRCLLFEDDLDYADSDAARARWEGDYATTKYYASGKTLPLRSGGATSDALVRAGWKLVDAVLLPSTKRVWDTAALGPERSGRGRVAEATGSGVDARLVTPLNLRSAASDAVLRFDHSFKFSDLREQLTNPAMVLHGGVSGGRVEVSRDDGQTWEPLVPLLEVPRLADGQPDLLRYNADLEELGLRPVFQRGFPASQQQCGRPTHPGCPSPEDLFEAPGGWLADGLAYDFTPLPSLSAHTPFGGFARDPERNSPLGLGSRAFTGTTCTYPTDPLPALARAERQDICGGGEDWREVAFDLSPYAGQEVLLAFHAFFTTHRDAAQAHAGCPKEPVEDCTPVTDTSPRFDDEIIVPEDFWRVDDLRVESRVLDGKNLHLRLRGFSDANGERLGWDVLNVTLLGDKHLRNAAVRFLDPLPGAPLLSANPTVDARVVNRGQETLRIRGSVLAEQAGSVVVRNPSFEVLGAGDLPDNWTATAAAGVSLAVATDAAEGARAFRATAPGGAATAFRLGPAPFRLRQDVVVPPGAWRLVGSASVDAVRGAAGVQLLGATAPSGRANPSAAFVADGAFRTFEVPFQVEGENATVQLAVVASTDLFPGSTFEGTVVVDHLRVEPRVASTFPALANGGFEAGLEGWDITGASARASGVADRYRIDFPLTQEFLPALTTTANGSDPVDLPFPVERDGLTYLEFRLNVSTSTVRPFDENVNVTLRFNGSVVDATTFLLPRGVGVSNPCPAQSLNTNPPRNLRTECQNVLNHNLVRPVIEPAKGTVRAVLPKPPNSFVVNATSPDEALAQAPPLQREGRGLWTVTVQVTPRVPDGLPVPHTEVHDVRVEPLLETYRVEAVEVKNVGVAVVGEGARSLLVSGLGLGAQDILVQQALALPAGKYRLEGLLGSKDAQVLLTVNEEGEPADDVLLDDDGDSVVQNVSAADLPRRVTGISVWSRTEVPNGTLTVRLTDVEGRPLGTGGTAELKASASFGASTIPVDAVIPFGLERVLINLSVGANDVQLETRPDGEYANGTLQGRDRDLRLALLGAHEPGKGTATARLNGGVVAGELPPLGVQEGGVPLAQSIEFPLRQELRLDGLGARRITSVAVNVTLPDRPDQLRSSDPDQGNFSLREGWIHALLLDQEGRPLSEEATYCACRLSLTAANNSNAALPQETVRAVLNFRNAFLPPGTTKVVLGLRVANFTAADNVRFGAVEDLRGTAGVPGDPFANGALLRNGEPLRAEEGFRCDDRQHRTPEQLSDEITRRAALGLPPPESVTCDLAVDLTWEREGTVTIDATGATGDPVVLVQPSNVTAPTVLTQDRRGGVAFAYDFIVPAGSTSTTLRVRADQWQGELVLDALRLVPLSTKAAVFEGSVSGGQQVALANGTRLATVRGASYLLRAEVLALDASGAPLPELLLGDNLATVATGPALGPGRVVLAKLEGDPNSINLTTGQSSQLRLTLRNEGATEVELQSAEGQVLRPDGTPLRQFSLADFDPVPESLSFAPLEERVFSWRYEPEATTPHGMYLLEAVVATQPVGDLTVASSRKESLLYIGTDFHQQFAFEWPFGNATEEDELDYLPDGENLFNSRRWTSAGDWNPRWPVGTCPPQDPEPPAQSNPCIGDAQNEAAVSTTTKNWMWHRTAAVNNSAFRSITLGADPEFLLGFVQGCNQNCVAEGTIFTVVRSPAIPITDMQRPQLVYADRHDFSGPEPEGSIYARLLDSGVREERSDWQVFPEGPCLDTERRHGWVLVDDHLQGTGPGYRQGKWFLRNIDLRPLLDRARDHFGEQDLERWDHVQLCWHLEQPSPAQGPSLIKEWSIDDVLVTPYGMALGPGQRIPITDNVSKDFRLLLTNRGAYTDTYEVRLEEETGLPSRGPSNWKVELFDLEGRPLREVRLAPGEERPVVVRVRVDVAPPTLAREGTVDLAVTALSRTTAMLRSTQHLVFDFTYEERSNLRIAGLIVNDATLSVDKPRTVDVLVQNNGPVVARRATVAVLDKMDAAFGLAPEELKQLDGTPVPEFDLAPGDTRVVTVNWVPRVEGEHNLTAIADPKQRLLEFDERDNTLVKPILVPKAEFPDLLVEATASQTNPSPGDLVEVSMRITNKGGAAAEGIQISIRAGVTDLLPGEPPHLLPQALLPGQTVTVNATWRPAFPGEQTLIARARTFAGVLERLETSGDNVQLLTLKVRSRGLDLGLPADLTLKPGGLANATIEVRNRGDVDDTYVLRLEPPDDWRGVFLPGGGEELRVTVGNHSARNVTVQLGAPRHAEAGPTNVVVHARSENGTEVLQAGLVVSIPQDFGIRFLLEPEHLLLPGVRFLPLTLVNGGNGVDTVTVRARSLPEGWKVDAQTFLVNPKSTTDVRVKVTSPTTTPEGAYPLVLEAQGKGGDLLAQRATVQVLPYELLGLKVEGVGEVLVPGQAVEGRLVVRNDGNVPARADLRLSVPEHWRLRLERDVVALAAGESRPLALGLVVPANATSKAQPLVALATSGTGARYDLTQAVRGARADLAVVALEQQPRGQVRDGATLTLVATLANQGEVALPATLAVYVDDGLLGFEEGPLVPPGEEAKVNVTFKAKGGEHVVLVAVDPAQQIGEEDEDDNARLLVLRIDRAAGLFAVPGLELLGMLGAVAGVAIALRRRKAVDR